MKFLISLLLVTSLYADIKTITMPKFLAYVGYVGTLCIDGYKFAIIVNDKSAGNPTLNQMFKDGGVIENYIPQPITCKDE